MDAQHDMLVKAYVFGENYQDIYFKNAVVDAIIAMATLPDVFGECWFPAGPHVDILYQSTAAGSRARLLMVYMHVTRASTHWFDGGVNNAEFVLDVARKFVQMRARSYASAEELWVSDPCLFHEHGPKGKCRLRLGGSKK